MCGQAHHLINVIQDMDDLLVCRLVRINLLAEIEVRLHAPNAVTSEALY